MNAALPIARERSKYFVKSLFKTIQGEGLNAGRPAAFVRFAGCNIWTGNKRTRAKEADRGCCVAFCDTDFKEPSHGVLSSEELAEQIREMVHSECLDLVVFTGGEPLLQLDYHLLELVSSILGSRVSLAVETNGTMPIPPFEKLHVAVSPKPPTELHAGVSKAAHEWKLLLHKAWSGEEIAGFGSFRFGTRFFAQPVDGIPMATNLANFEKSRKSAAVLGIDLRLGVQAHKVWDIP